MFVKFGGYFKFKLYMWLSQLSVYTACVNAWAVVSLWRHSTKMTPLWRHSPKGSVIALSRCRSWFPTNGGKFSKNHQIAWKPQQRKWLRIQSKSTGTNNTFKKTNEKCHSVVRDNSYALNIGLIYVCTKGYAYWHLHRIIFFNNLQVLNNQLFLTRNIRIRNI